MPPTIHLVRHAQGYHNLAVANHGMHDPQLTPLGKEQCAALHHTFPYLQSIDLVVASPIKRTISTALLSFEPTIRSKNLTVVALPELQEVSSMPCDTGSPKAELEREFSGEPVDLGLVIDDWDSKTGRWAPSTAAIDARCKAARQWLMARKEEHIAVVTHGAVLHYFTDDWESIVRMQGTGWTNTEFRSYTFDTASGDDAALVETAESRQRRKGSVPPLSPAEQKALRANTLSDWEGYGMVEKAQSQTNGELTRQKSITTGIEGPQLNAMNALNPDKRELVEGCSA